MIAWLDHKFGTFGADYELQTAITGEPFLTPPGALSDAVAAAAKDVTGLDAVLSTSGGTSDARFIKDHCTVAEFGLISDTAHKVDEWVATEDLYRLTEIYLVALNLTRNQNDFAVRFDGGGSSEIAGVDDDTAVVTLTDDLSAAVSTTSDGMPASTNTLFTQSAPARISPFRVGSVEMHAMRSRSFSRSRLASAFSLMNAMALSITVEIPPGWRSVCPTLGRVVQARIVQRRRRPANTVKSSKLTPTAI